MDAVGMQAGSYRYFEKNLKIQEPGSGMYSLPTGTLGTFQNKGLSESDFCLRQISLVWVRGILGSGVWGRHEWKAGVSKPKSLYMEWINKVLLYSTENNYVQHPMINHNGK